MVAEIDEIDKKLNYEIIINPIFLQDNRETQVVILQVNNMLGFIILEEI